MPRLPVTAALVAVLVLVGACSSGGSKSVPDGVPGPVSFALSGVEVQSVNEPAPPFPDDVRTKVMATLDSYVERATTAPLRAGTQAGDLTVLFTPAALARVNGADRPALVDEGLPRASGLQPQSATVRLGALAGADNEISVVTATIDLRVQTLGADPLAVARSGDLILVPVDGSWKIDGYDLSTARDSGSGATTTTARR